MTSVRDVASYWDQRPCNIRHSAQPIGTRAYFDDVERRKYFVEPHIPGFAQFERWNGKRVLELGCGIGTDTINFARAGASVTAVDISHASLQIARQRAKVFSLTDRIRFICADMEDLGFGSERFDLIYSFGVIHHTPHPDRAIRALVRYAGRSTDVRIMLYHKWSTKVLSGAVARGHAEAQEGCPIAYTYSRRDARSLLEDNGLRVTSSRVDHIFPWRVEDYVQYRYVPKLWVAATPAPAFRWLERQVGWHILLTAHTQ